jgi:hypothetical protein
VRLHDDDFTSVLFGPGQEHLDELPPIGHPGSVDPGSFDGPVGRPEVLGQPLLVHEHQVRETGCHSVLVVTDMTGEVLWRQESTGKSGFARISAEKVS